VEPTSGDSAGLEPRVQLELTAPQRARLVVTTVSEQNVLVDGVTSTRSITAGMNVDAILTRNAENFQLDVIRELTSFSPEDMRPLDFELARITEKYDVNGQSLGFDPDQSIFDVLALESFYLPALTLSHPPMPLGVGATWTEQNTLQSLSATTVTRIDALSSSTLSVTKTIDTGSDEQNRYTVTGAMSSVYSLPSLLLQSADISITIRFQDQLYINGSLQSIVDDSTLSQTIREAVK